MILLLLLVSGCGKGKGNVSGEVTVGGKPLTMGMVVFQPDSGPAVSAEIADGKYQATGVPTGKVKVYLDLSSIRLIVDQEKPKTGSAAMAAKFGKGEDAVKQKSLNPQMNAAPANMPAEAKQALEAQMKERAEATHRAKDAVALYKDIPDKYSSADGSGLSLDVSMGDNTFDIKIAK